LPYLWMCLFWTFHANGIMKYMVLCGCCVFRAHYVDSCISIQSFLWRNMILLCVLLLSQRICTCFWKNLYRDGIYTPPVVLTRILWWKEIKCPGQGHTAGCGAEPRLKPYNSRLGPISLNPTEGFWKHDSKDTAYW
jgi:hypothetical protein